MKLFAFQAEAATTIAERYVRYAQDENRPYYTKHHPVPFYQALSALTGAGKTPILADAIQQMCSYFTVKPIVLWLTKSKVVIDQTYLNFSSGGKYSNLIDESKITYLSNLTPSMIMDNSNTLICFSTVATFNQKDKEGGNLRIYKVAPDVRDTSIWNNLKSRKTKFGFKRPLIIVYDEGHNLSDQQVDILFELHPEVFLTASATLKTPGKLGQTIERLKNAGWKDNLVTSISSKDLIDSELIKKQIILGGYLSSMETAINNMLDSFNRIVKKAKELGIPINPKAIYVCKTNISEDTGKKDDPKMPFCKRKAPPILIWRYLVEIKKINPDDIAVYCNLAVDRRFSLPEYFHLFNKGENDFNDFQKGNYRHIIFNQSLQEGWDDPECYFAYIDKSMGSKTQVEQVIGRLLRQPTITYFPFAELNTAHFFIRYDEDTVFPEILKEVSKKLSTDTPEIALTSFEHRSNERVIYNPKKVQKVPYVYINAKHAKPYLASIVDSIHDYTLDKKNTVGHGYMKILQQQIGTGTNAKEIDNKILPNSNKMRARRIISYEIMKLYPFAEAIFPTQLSKFDAMVDVTSNAAKALRKSAEEFVDVYLKHSYLMYDKHQEFTVGPVIINPDNANIFNNSLHEKYSDLNNDEYVVANELDKTGYLWARNPSNGGYFIPLLEKGKGSKKFFPDFLVWAKKNVFAIDVKGKHILNNDLAAKLLNIQGDFGEKRLIVRFVVKGKWTDDIKLKDNTGYTVWVLKHGKIEGLHYKEISKAIERCLQVNL